MEWSNPVGGEYSKSAQLQDAYLCEVDFGMQALNLILLTASELADLRALLKQSLTNPAGRDLFVALYSSWCHSPMATVSLCLLAQVSLLGMELCNN